MQDLYHKAGESRLPKLTDLLPTNELKQEHNKYYINLKFSCTDLAGDTMCNHGTLNTRQSLLPTAS
jgi:hypothetical protein